MPGVGSQEISQSALLRTHYAFLALTTVVVAIRVVIHLTKRRSLEVQDGFFYLAYAAFISMWICYVMSVPLLYTLGDAQNRTSKSDPNFVKDAARSAQLIFSAQMLYYSLLTAAKLSFLTLYRKLLVGLSNTYHRIWWAIICIVILVWIGCIMSTVLACLNLTEFLATGNCIDRERNIPGLVFSYVSDAVTDLMVMILPIHLCWNLSIPRGRKIGIYVLFCSGFICILFSTLRFVQACMEDGKIVTPNPRWLQVWTTLESSMAVIVSCAPAIAAVLRGGINVSSPSYNSSGHVQRDASRELLRMGNMRSSRIEISCNYERSNSQERLTSGAAQVIRVTKTVHVSGGSTTSNSFTLYPARTVVV